MCVCVCVTLASNWLLKIFKAWSQLGESLLLSYSLSRYVCVCVCVSVSACVAKWVVFGFLRSGNSSPNTLTSLLCDLERQREDSSLSTSLDLDIDDKFLCACVYQTAA